MRKTKFSFLFCLMLLLLSFAACGSKETVTESQSDSGKTKLTMTEIESLAAERVFNVHWYTTDGDYSSGTAFLMDSKEHGEKLLVTAFHFLWPDNAETFTGEELPEYVNGGRISYAYDGTFTGASLKSNVVIKDADAVPAVDKDVAAFTIQSDNGLKTLELASTMPKKGDTIYLLASLWDTEDIHENCVYEGEVSSVGKGVIYYTLEGKPGTTGASGGPVINEYGEVVAMHMASNPLMFVGHSADSFGKQIATGSISEITYANLADSVQEEAAGEETGVEEFNCGDKVSTLFYDLQVNEVTYADTLAGKACEEGYEYVVVDLSLWAAEGMAEPVAMYYYDFALEWMESYSEPLEAGLVEGQLPDEYTITNAETKGKLVFMAPKGEATKVLSFVDYYFVEETEEPQYGTYYIVYMPEEDWTR